MGREVWGPAAGETTGLGTRYWERRGLGAGCWRDHRPRFVAVGVWAWDLLENFKPNYLARIRSVLICTVHVDVKAACGVPTCV